MKSFVKLSLGSLLVAVVIGTPTAEAKGLLNLLKSSAAPQVMPEPVTDAMVGGPVGCTAPVPAPVCCPTPCIRYRHALFPLCKKVCCDPCKPPIKTVLCVNNPCSCCPVSVPVCLPGCCCDAPKVSCKKTLFGAGTVTYDWCCGVSVTVRFDKCGDVLVTYRGV